MEGSPLQQLKKFLEPYERDELISLIMGGATENNEVCDTLLKKIKNDKKWCKLFVHGLPFTTTEQTLEQYYSKWGTVKEAVILKNNNGESKGYGFVTFSSADETLNAAKVDKKKIDDRITHCNLAYKGNPKKHDPQSNNINSQHNQNYNHHNNNNNNSHNTNILSSPSQRENTKDRRLFVHSLAWKTDDATLYKIFGEYGDIEEALVIRDKRTGKSKGYGFVTFRFPDSAIAALNNPEKIIDDRKTNSDYAWKRERSHDGEGSHGIMDDNNDSHPPTMNMNVPLPQQPIQSFAPSQMMMNNNHLNGSSNQGSFMTMNNAPSLHVPQGNFQDSSMMSMMQSQSSQQINNMNNQQPRQNIVGNINVNMGNNGQTPSTPPYNFQQLLSMKNTQPNVPGFVNPVSASGVAMNVLSSGQYPTQPMESTFIPNINSGQQNLSRGNIQSQMMGKNLLNNSNNNTQNYMQSLNTMEQNNFNNRQDLNIQTNTQKSKPTFSSAHRGTNNSPVTDTISGTKTSTKKPILGRNNNNDNNNIHASTPKEIQQTQSKSSTLTSAPKGVNVGDNKNSKRPINKNNNRNNNQNISQSPKSQNLGEDDTNDK